SLRAPTPTLFPYTTLFRSRRNVANALAQAEQRDAIQHLGLAVRREGRDQALHSLRVCRIPCGLRAVAIKHFDGVEVLLLAERRRDRKSTRLNSSHRTSSYA